jgi:hypothetical protein
MDVGEFGPSLRYTSVNVHRNGRIAASSTPNGKPLAPHESASRCHSKS